MYSKLYKIHGHNHKTLVDNSTMRQAVDSVMKGKDLKWGAKKYKELGEAVDYWGRKVRF
jgi:ribulose 1,5-bisphosphate carboxylase large subunit-like protein